MAKGRYWNGSDWSVLNADTANASMVIPATGTGTAIILTDDISSGYYINMKLTFVASSNNNGAATTINLNGWGAKPLYKPGTTSAPSIVSGKAYTIWYNGTNFFLQASAEGDAVVADVLAGKTFSNDNDTGLVGTIPSKGAQTYTPGTANQIIASGQYLSGAQTISGSANLTAGNIKTGVNIFGVDGELNPSMTTIEGEALTVTGDPLSVRDVVQFNRDGSIQKAVDSSSSYTTSGFLASSELYTYRTDWGVRLTPTLIVVGTQTGPNNRYVEVVEHHVDGKSPVSLARADITYSSTSNNFSAVRLNDTQLLLIQAPSTGAAYIARIITVIGTSITITSETTTPYYGERSGIEMKLLEEGVVAITYMNTSSARLGVMTISGTTITHRSVITVLSSANSIDLDVLYNKKRILTATYMQSYSLVLHLFQLNQDYTVTELSSRTKTGSQYTTHFRAKPHFISSTYGVVTYRHSDNILNYFSLTSDTIGSLSTSITFFNTNSGSIATISNVECLRKNEFMFLTSEGSNPYNFKLRRVILNADNSTTLHTLSLASTYAYLDRFAFLPNKVLEYDSSFMTLAAGVGLTDNGMRVMFYQSNPGGISATVRETVGRPEGVALTGGSGPVNVLSSGIVQGFTSLVPGSLYYKTSSGGVSSTINGQPIGVALTTTTMLFKMSNSWPQQVEFTFGNVPDTGVVSLQTSGLITNTLDKPIGYHVGGGKVILLGVVSGLTGLKTGRVYYDAFGELTANPDERPLGDAMSTGQLLISSPIFSI